MLEYAHANDVEPFLEPTLELTMALLHLSASTGVPLAGRLERTNGTRGTFPADCCSSREKPLDGPPPPPAAPTGYDTHGLLDALPTLAQLCCHPDAAVAMLAAACTAELAGLHPAAAAHELLSEPQLGAVADALRGFEPGSPHEELALCLLGIVARAAAQAPELLIGPSVVVLQEAVEGIARCATDLAVLRAASGAAQALALIRVRV